MLNLKILLVVICALFIFQITCCAEAQNYIQIEELITNMETKESPSIMNPYLEQLLRLIKNGDWAKIPQNQKDRVITVLIKQLTHGKRVAEVGESEVAFRYLQLLGQIAGELKDTRIIPVLVEGINAGNYADALTKIGGPAVDPLVKKYNSSSVNEKRFILGIFEDMEPGTIKNKKAAVKNCILKAGKDEEMYVRVSAIRALFKLGDKDVVPVIEEMAKNDVDFYEVDTASGPWKGYGTHKRYIVREEASEALKRIKARMKAESHELPSGTTQQNTP